MPLRMVCANPVILAALAVVAIGVITYQIITKQKQKKIPVRGRIHYRDDYDDPDDDPDDNPDKPGKGPGGSSERFEHDNDGTVETSKDLKSGKSDDDSSGLRRRTVATQSSENELELEKMNIMCDESKISNSFSNSLNVNSGSPGDINNQATHSSEQNGEIQDLGVSVNQESSKMASFVPNINDEDADSDSSESNNSVNSVGNDTRNKDLCKCICGKENISIIGKKKFRALSPNTKEEIYKREVSNNLKTDIEHETHSEKYCKNIKDEESDASREDLSVGSDGSSTSGACGKKLMMCRGCLEDFANAVAHPCKHCYLCLDCAIKVHRIYSKCTVCNSVIKTFEQLKM